MSKVMLKLRKGEQVKYLSHLDVMRAIEFALRRAGIPMAYSEGFNPRPRMSLGAAVGVGVTSDDERIVLDLASAMTPHEVTERLNSKLPAGFGVLDAEAVPEGVKSPLSGLNASRFRITLSCGGRCDSTAVEAAIGEILRSQTVPVTRTREGGTKVVDIRPHVLTAGVVEFAGDSASVEVALKLGDSGGARPQDFVQALVNLVSNLSVERIHRLEQFRAGAEQPDLPRESVK